VEIVLHDTIVNQGFTQSEADPCLYTSIQGESRVHMLVWILCSNYDELLKCTKQMLSNSFKMKDIGITMSQKEYTERVLKRVKYV
jgi:hypothetical protein